MRITRTSIAVLAVCLTAGLAPATTAGAAAKPRPVTSQPEKAETARTAAAGDAYGKLPTAFAVNRGQAPADVRYSAAGKGFSLALTAADAVLTLTAPAAGPAAEPAHGLHVADPSGQGGSAVRMRLDGANPHPAIEGLDQLPGVANYLTGNDPKGWHTNVATFARVAYRDVYPGIDLVWYGHEGQLEHDFVVAPDADPDVIKVVFDGADHLGVDGDHVEIFLPGGGTLTERMPAIYQTVGGERRPITGHFEALGADRVGFAVAPYDTARALVIDPVLDYSTYLGGTGGAGDEAGSGIAVDGTGHAYVVGFTSSLDFPTTAGAVDEAPGADGSNAFVTKLNPTGTALEYSTYLGGTGSDSGAAIAVEGGDAYVTGNTQSTDFPTTAGAFQETDPGGSSNGFVTKLNTTGTALEYSTYLGGTGFDAATGIAVEGGNAYVTGNTDSVDFPTTLGAFAEAPGPGDGDAFVTKLNTTGTALEYSTYLGGATGFESDSAIAVESGTAYITGFTTSDDFPTTVGAFDEAPGPGGGAVFVTKLNTTGTALEYSTYLGGTGSPLLFGSGIAVESGNAYVTGITASVDFPTTPGAFDEAPGPGGDDLFVTKLNTTGTALDYSTYLGGTGLESFPDIAVESGHAYLTGLTGSEDFPTTPGAFDETPDLANRDEHFVTKLNTTGTALDYSTFFADGNAIAVEGGNAYITGGAGSVDFPTTPGAFDEGPSLGVDAFVAKFNTTGTALDYSTLFGGSPGADGGVAIAVDPAGNSYVTGNTRSVDFPTTPGGFGEPPGAGSFDVFVTKLNPTGTAVAYSTYLGGSGFERGLAIAIDGAGSAYITGNTQSFDFPVTAGAFDETRPGGFSDAFVTKLNPTGTALEYSTYLGGTGRLFDIGLGIAVDGGNAYVTGFTDSVDFPTTPGAFDGDGSDGANGFVTKLNPTGTALDYSTYLGGSDADGGAKVAVEDGKAYIFGDTDSVDFPTTTGAFGEGPPGPGTTDLFVTKLNTTGTALEYSTYLGGTGTDEAFATTGSFGLAVENGYAYVAAFTDSDDFPTTAGAFEEDAPDGANGFVTKLNPAGTSLEYSTYLGGNSFDFIKGIAIEDGNAYVTGVTVSDDFPTTSGALEESRPGGSDAFVTRLSDTGRRLEYSTFLGGTANDEAEGIAVRNGAAYVTGSTFSVDFPSTTGAFQTANPGTPFAGDAFVTKISIPTGGGGGGNGGGGNGGGGGHPDPKSASITIEKRASHADGKPFGFHTKVLKPKTFHLEDGATRTFAHLEAGTYTVAEDKSNGWTLDRLVCADPTHNTKVSVKNRRATIKVKAGEHVKCTFTDSRNEKK